MVRGTFLILTFISPFVCFPLTPFFFFPYSPHNSPPHAFHSSLHQWSFLTQSFQPHYFRCPLFLLIFALGMMRDVLPLMPPLYCFSHPTPERYRGRREEGGRKRGLGGGMRRAGKRKGARQKEKDHTASWLNEHGQRVITIEYIMLLLVEAIS